MAKPSGGDEWKWGLGILFAGFLYYQLSGKGRDNALLIPDALEDRIDHVVEALNGAFGQRWVNVALNALQAHIVQTMPGLAGLVNAVYRAELAYRGYSNAGVAKKQAAMRFALSRG